MEEDEEQALLAQAQQRILAEREQRGYHVVVEDMMRAESMAGNLIPETFDVYSAETRCTEKHPHGQQCLWVDYIFHWRGHWQVVLFNDLMRPGTLLIKQARIWLSDFEMQVKHWYTQEGEERIKQLVGHLPFIELIEPHEFTPGYTSHEGRWYKIMERSEGKALCQECTAREFALLVLSLRDTDPTRGKQSPHED